ncbi:hypothetical protein ACN469_20775 [Corallococcus terminator]
MKRLSRSLEVFVVTGLLSLGCSGEEPTSPAREREIEASPVFGEHRVREPAQKGLAAVGMDCGVGGKAGCASGLCLHTGKEPGEGYVCSKPCAVSADCPSEWRCAQLQPGSSARVCLPLAR